MTTPQAHSPLPSSSPEQTSQRQFWHAWLCSLLEAKINDSWHEAPVEGSLGNTDHSGDPVFGILADERHDEDMDVLRDICKRDFIK